MYLKIYQKYLITNFIKILIEVTLIFSALIFIFGLLEEINFFKNLDESFFYPLMLSFLNLPSLIYDIFPFIFIITTQFLFIKINDKNELPLIKINGISNLEVMGILILTTFFLSILINILFYNLSSNLKHHYLSIKNSFSTTNKYLAVITENGLWIKDEIDGKTLIVNSYELDNQFLLNAEISEFDEKFNLIKIINSEKVDISKKDWLIKNAKISKENQSNDLKDDIILKTNFNSEILNNYFSNLKSLSFFELIDSKKNYKKLGYSTEDIEIHLQKFYTYPFYVTVMTLLSCVLMLNIKYNKPKLLYIILGIILSVIIYYINLFSAIFGQSFQIPSKIAAIFPLIIISLSCCVGLVKINEK